MTLVHRTWRLSLVIAVLVAAAAIVAVPASAKGVGVSIVGKAFDPATSQVQVGDTVTWTVTEAIAEPHSVTAGKPGDTGTPLFDSGITLQKNGDTYEYTFDKAGTYDYYCQVHPTVMTGKIEVLAAGQTGAAESPATESPAAESPPALGGETGGGIPPERKLIAAGILAATLIVLFGAATLWRRVNPA